MDPRDFRPHAHRVADWMADYLNTVEDHPVRSQVAPGDIAAQLAERCPDGLMAVPARLNCQATTKATAMARKKSSQPR